MLINKQTAGERGKSGKAEMSGIFDRVLPLHTKAGSWLKTSCVETDREEDMTH